MKDIKRRFPVIMDLYSGAGHLIRQIDTEVTQKLIMVDSSGPLPLSPFVLLLTAKAEKTLYRDQAEEYDGEHLHGACFHAQRQIKSRSSAYC